MTVPQALPFLFAAAKGHRHKYYDRTVAKATKYMALATGEGMDAMLRKFARRESEELFKQRKEITQHITQSVVGNIMAIYNKLPRSRYTQNVYHTGKESSGDTKELIDIMGQFWGNKSLDDWFATRYMELNSVDPNAWCVLEFEPTDGKDYARPYPFEVSAAQAVDFGITNQVLDYLIVKHDMTVMENKTAVPSQKLTLYLANETVVLLPIPRNQAPLKRKDGELIVTSETNEQGEQVPGMTYVWLNERPYVLLFPTPHNLDAVPAFRIGFQRDLYTGGATYVSCFDKAVPFLEKSLKINSEADLTKSLAAFPLTLRYADPCEAPGCQNGYMSEGGKCESCHGTGVKRPTSVQEEMVFQLPLRSKPEDVLDLDKLWIWKSPPIDLLKYQDEVVDALSRRAVEIVFNSDIYTRQEVADTATGKRLSLENTYDTLYTMGLDYAEKWRFSVVSIAKITELDTDLIVSMRFPRDFAMKDVGELLDEYAKATTSGAGPEVRQGLEEAMVSVMLVDDPAEYRRFEVKSLWNPFRGMTESEISIALNTSYTPTRLKVQYLNLGNIFDSIEAEQAEKGLNFYVLTYTKQKELIDAKVMALMLETASTAPILPIPGGG